MMLTLFCSGWAGSADGAVLLGGKWGLLLRRPLEAMSRTLPLVFFYWFVVALSLKKLYLWAAVTDVSAALKSGWINEVQARAIEFKRPMLNPVTFIWVSVLCFAIWAFYHGGSILWDFNGMRLPLIRRPNGSRNLKTSADPALSFTPSQ